MKRRWSVSELLTWQKQGLSVFSLLLENTLLCEIQKGRRALMASAAPPAGMAQPSFSASLPSPQPPRLPPPAALVAGVAILRTLLARELSGGCIGTLSMKMLISLKFSFHPDPTRADSLAFRRHLQSCPFVLRLYVFVFEEFFSGVLEVC